jgi:hypothetical protein
MNRMIGAWKQHLQPGDLTSYLVVAREPPLTMPATAPPTGTRGSSAQDAQVSISTQGPIEIRDHHLSIAPVIMEALTMCSTILTDRLHLR